jgi:hypothetical protein
MPRINSHMPCRAPALFLQCRVLRESPRGSQKYPNYWSNSLIDHPFCSVLLPLFTVIGTDHCEEDWYASDNNLCGTPRGSWKKLNTGRQTTGHLSTAVLCCAVALRRTAWSEHSMGAAWQMCIRHGRTV